MRDQKHNKGDLAQLTVNLEQGVIESIQNMSKNTGMSVDEIVVIALKRFRASHSDYEGNTPNINVETEDN